MQNLLRPRVARSVTTGLVGRAVLCPPDAESTGCFSCTNRLLARSRARKSAESQTQAKMPNVPDRTGARWAARPTLTLRLSVSAVKRSRARKGADGRIPAEKPGLHNQPQRAVDCAPYLTLCAFGQIGARPSRPQLSCDRDGRARRSRARESAETRFYPKRTGRRDGLRHVLP